MPLDRRAGARSRGGALGRPRRLRAPRQDDPDAPGPAELDAVTDATRALARSVDPTAARIAVCEGAREVAGAPVAALFEPAAERRGPDRQGQRRAPSSTGCELPLAGEVGAALAFARAEEVFVGAGDAEAEADREFMQPRGRARRALAPGRPRPGGDRGPRDRLAGPRSRGSRCGISTMIDLLGAEAAVAIGRADLLGQLEHLARTDGLTGLPNRRHWEQQLPRELARAWRDRRRLCVAMLDLDYFKDYNDRHGHQAGDRLLREAAAAWRGRAAPLRHPRPLRRRGVQRHPSRLRPRRRASCWSSACAPRRPQGESCSAGIAEWDGDESARGARRPRRRGALPGQARRARPRRSSPAEADADRHARARLRAPPRAPAPGHVGAMRTIAARRRSPVSLCAAALRGSAPRAVPRRREPGLRARCARRSRERSAAGARARPASARSRWAAPYEGVARELVAALKFGARARARGARPRRPWPSALGPPARARRRRRPGAPDRLRRRGFDPAELIAAALAAAARARRAPAAAPRRRAAPGRALGARAPRARRRPGARGRPGARPRSCWSTTCSPPARRSAPAPPRCAGARVGRERRARRVFARALGRGSRRGVGSAAEPTERRQPCESRSGAATSR